MLSAKAASAHNVVQENQENKESLLLNLKSQNDQKNAIVNLEAGPEVLKGLSRRPSVVGNEQSYYRGLGGGSISMQSHGNVSLLVKHLFNNQRAAVTSNILEKGSMREKSLNNQEIGGATSQITQEDLISLRDMLGFGKL